MKLVKNKTKQLRQDCPAFVAGSGISKVQQVLYLLLLTFVILSLSKYNCSAQSPSWFVNNNSKVHLLSGIYVVVGGNVLNNNNGVFDNSGTIQLTGNWTNNAGNTAFVNSSPGTVTLLGDTQIIGGADPTKFYNLDLQGTGVKTLQVNSMVEGVLSLNDRELSTQGYSMSVLNTNVSAITRTSGFVSSTGTGCLSWNTGSASAYLFPVGSSTGTARYRPVEFTPSSAAANTFTARMANVDATTEGFDRTITDGTVSNINDKFYHRINRTAGTDAAKISIYFDNVADGTFAGIAHWDDTPTNEWENAGTVTAVNNVSPILSSLSVDNWSDYTGTPVALFNCVPPTITTQPSGSTICVNGSANFSVTASGTAPFTYQWQYNNGSWNNVVNGTPAGATYSNPTTAMMTVSGISGAGSYQYRCVVTNVCGSTTSNVATLTVTPNNTVTLASAIGTDNQTKCINTAITNITYSTTGATGATVTGLPAGVTGAWAANVVTISGTPTASGTFNYTVTLMGGCGTVTASGTITVTPDNTVALTSAAGTDTQTICINTAITNITYATTGATGTIVTGLPAGVTGNWAANTVTISGTPTASGTFNYTVTLTGGCGTITATGTITVTPNNTVTLTSAVGTDNQTKCINTAITNITYSTTGATGATVTGLPAGVTGAWAANVVTISGTPTASGTFNYTVTLTGGCGTVTAGGTVTVNPLPSPTASNNGPVCAGSTLSLTGLPNGMTNYSWSGPNGFTSTSQSPTVSASATTAMAGAYTLTVINGNGCTNTATTTATVNTLPTPTALNNSPVCVGSTLLLTGLPNGMTNYSWSGPNGFTSTSQSPTVSASATTAMAGTYTLTVINGNGCTNTATTTATVNTLPTPTINGSLSYCTGFSTLLQTEVYSNYQWSNGSTNQSTSVTVANNPITVTVTDANGCTGISASVNVTENTTLTPVITGTMSYCAGSNTTLQTGNYNSYQWSTGSTNQSTSVTIADNPITVTVTDANGCTATATAAVTANPTYNVPVNASICQGQTYTLPDNSVVSTAGNYTTTLQTMNSCDSIIVTQLIVNPVFVISSVVEICNGSSYVFNGHIYTTAGNYFDTLITVNSCDSIIITQLTVNPVYLENESAAICFGQSYNFGGIEYTTAGVYTHTFTSVSGCDSTVTLTLAVNSLPVVALGNDTSICFGNSIVLDAGNPGSVYQWTGGAATQTLTVSASGNYSVTVTNANNCTASDTIIL